jgi:hypothetical protein
VRDGAAEDEAARLDAGHLLDAFALVVLGDALDRDAQAQVVAQQRGDVPEQDAGLGMIGNRANA